jgi:hypothetical protein
MPLEQAQRDRPLPAAQVEHARRRGEAGLPREQRFDLRGGRAQVVEILEQLRKVRQQAQVGPVERGQDGQLEVGHDSPAKIAPVYAPLC